MLATSIKLLGYNPDLDVLLQVTNEQKMTHKSTWMTSQMQATILDRNKGSCANSLIRGDLTEIKTFCRYHVYHAPMPKGVIRLFENTFLLTNIKELHLHCFNANWTSQHERTVTLTEIQVLYTFNCQCTGVSADEFVITTDLSHCNITDNATVLFDVQFAVNLAFLSEFFEISELAGIMSDTVINHTIQIDVPALSRAEKEVEDKFAVHEAIHYDMIQIINRTKEGAQVFDDLSHFMYNTIIKAHGKRKGDGSVFTVDLANHRWMDNVWCSVSACSYVEI